MPIEHPISVPVSAGRARSFGAGEILLVTAGILPALAVFAPLGLAPLLAAAAAMVAISDRRRCLDAAPGFAPLIAMLVALAAWATLSASWSIAPRHSLLEGLRFLAIAVAGIALVAAATALSPHERSRLQRAAIAGVLLGVVLLLAERVSDGAITRFALGTVRAAPQFLTRFDRGTTTLVLALWPALVALGAMRRRWSSILAFAVLAAAAVMLSTTARVAAVLAIVIFAMAYVAPRLVTAALAAGLVLAAAALPIATPDARVAVALHQHFPTLKNSALHRLLIWRFTADRIAERPLLGWGMDASRDLPGGHANLAQLVPGAGLSPSSEALPLHPHNALLQWLVELGVPGVLLGLAIVGWVLWRIGCRGQLSSGRRAAAIALAAAALLIGLLSYGAWQAWWLSCLWLLAAIFAGVAPADQSRTADAP